MIVLPTSLSEMAASPRWLLWRRDESRKIPIGVNARWGLNEATTGTFDACLTLWLRTPDAFAGVGYKPDYYACLDFDKLEKCPDSLAIWNELRRHTYCEFSPSGKGGHALVTLAPDAKRRLKGIRYLMPGIELYSDSGFFTVTGRAIAHDGIHRHVADASNFLWNLADRLGKHAPISHNVSTLPTGRIVSQIEKGRIIEKIGKWRTAEDFRRLHHDATWIRGVQDSSFWMFRFVKFLVAAGARDPDLLWAIIKDAAIWREFESRKLAKRNKPERLLWDSMVPDALAEVPPPAPSTGQPVTPSFMRGAV